MCALSAAIPVSIPVVRLPVPRKLSVRSAAFNMEIWIPINHQAASEWTQENDKHYHKCIYGCDTHLDETDCSGGTATCFQKSHLYRVQQYIWCIGHASFESPGREGGNLYGGWQHRILALFRMYEKLFRSGMEVRKQQTLLCLCLNIPTENGRSQRLLPPRKPEVKQKVVQFVDIP